MSAGDGGPPLAVTSLTLHLDQKDGPKQRELSYGDWKMTRGSSLPSAEKVPPSICTTRLSPQAAKQSPAGSPAPSLGGTTPPQPGVFQAVGLRLVFIPWLRDAVPRAGCVAGYPWWYVQ